jgi:hypothetical protein
MRPSDDEQNRSDGSEAWYGHVGLETCKLTRSTVFVFTCSRMRLSTLGGQYENLSDAFNEDTRVHTASRLK